MRFTMKKKIAAAGLAAATIVGGATAYAYWTAGGSGTGTATAGSTTALTVNQTSVLTAMYPGDSAQALSGDFDNTNAGPIYVHTVTAAIDSVVKASDAPAGTCDASDFTLADAAMTVDAEVPAGTGVGSWSGATLHFNDKSNANQDACKGATVNLSYTIG